MTSRTATTKNHEQALAALVAREAEIAAMLARLQALSDDHFAVGPHDLTWSHDDEVAHDANLLEQITDMALGDEGEHALERRAAALGLTTDETIDAAPGLLDGRRWSPSS